MDEDSRVVQRTAVTGTLGIRLSVHQYLPLKSGGLRSLELRFHRLIALPFEDSLVPIEFTHLPVPIALLSSLIDPRPSFADSQLLYFQT